MKRRGRRSALLMGGAAALVVVCAGYFLKDTILEEILIWKLSSTTEEEWRAAAQELGRRKCARAVPRLLYRVVRGSKLFIELADGDEQGKPDFEDLYLVEHGVLRATVRIGQGAVPHLLDAIRNGDEGCRVAAYLVLIELSTDNAKVLSLTEEMAAREPDPYMQRIVRNCLASRKEDDGPQLDS